MTDIVIYGRGKTGQSLLKLLQEQEKDAVFYDDEKGFSRSCEFTQNTTVLLSPGVKPTAKGLTLAEQSGAKIVSELEYCFPLCKAQCISVTGTNGKTTMCELIHHILKHSGIATRLLGNGGVPFAEQVLHCSSNEVVVLESSSFQLNRCSNFSPKVSVLTNLATDHLDYHQSIARYSIAKQNNFVHQRSDAFAIFNADDKNALALSQKSNGHAMFYSVNNSFANCFCDGKMVYLNVFGRTQKQSAKVLSKMYLHNQSNCLGAILACSVFGVSLRDSLQAISTYKFPLHRMQVVDEFCGITFVDDSKGTNIHATVSACNSIQTTPLALILGGSQKGYPFDELFQNLPQNVLYICATGQTAQSIAMCGKKHGRKVRIFEHLKQCVRYCFDSLKEIGGTVLMSNACASFDKFGSYAERGNYFQHIVEELKFESQV